MSLIVTKVIHAYQRLVSPWLGDNCRFYPSCSEFAKQSIQQHGCIIGLVLTCWRLLRCHPLAKGGVDEVPSLNRLYSALKKERGEKCKISKT